MEVDDKTPIDFHGSRIKVSEAKDNSKQVICRLSLGGAEHLPRATSYPAFPLSFDGEQLLGGSDPVENEDMQHFILGFCANCTRWARSSAGVNRCGSGEANGMHGGQSIEVNGVGLIYTS